MEAHDDHTYALLEELRDHIKDLTFKVEELEVKVDAMNALWLKAQGMWLLIKIAVCVGGPLLGVIAWFKEHLKWA